VQEATRYVEKVRLKQHKKTVRLEEGSSDMKTALEGTFW